MDNEHWREFDKVQEKLDKIIDILEEMNEREKERLDKKAEDQILQVAIPYWNVTTKPGKNTDKVKND